MPWDVEKYEDKPSTPEEIIAAYRRTMGRKGGKAKSDRKREASKRNLEKARKVRAQLLNHSKIEKL